MLRNAAVVAPYVAVAPVAGAGGPEVPLRVFVTAAHVEARKALDKQLKDQLGKKRESWPPEKDDELYRLEEAEALAEADYEYRKIDPKGIADSVEDLTESIQGKGMAGRKERIILTSSADDADLVVEVAAPTPPRPRSTGSSRTTTRS